MVKTSKSSALSATFRSSPTSPKTNITSAEQGPTRWPLRERGKAPWPTRLLALVMRTFPVGLQNFFTGAIVCPVLTAHPTEVRRKSTIDREMEVAQLLAERDR